MARTIQRRNYRRRYPTRRRKSYKPKYRRAIRPTTDGTVSKKVQYIAALSGSGTNDTICYVEWGSNRFAGAYFSPQASTEMAKYIDQYEWMQVRYCKARFIPALTYGAQNIQVVKTLSCSKENDQASLTEVQMSRQTDFKMHNPRAEIFKKVSVAKYARRNEGKKGSPWIRTEEWNTGAVPYTDRGWQFLVETRNGGAAEAHILGTLQIEWWISFKGHKVYP